MSGTTNNQVNLLIDGIKNTDFSELKYFGIYSSPNVSNLSRLSELTKITKETINYIYMYENNISELNFLSDYKNVFYFNIRNNPNIITLAGIQNMIRLSRLYANNCNLGSLEEYDINKENAGRNSSTDALSYINTSYITSLDSLEFVKNLTNVKELDLRGCSNLLDLSPLDTYKIPLRTLRIDNINIDLTKIQYTISHLGSSNPDSTFASATWYDAGLMITNTNLLKKLSDCTEITSLSIHNSVNYGSTILDLSKCTKLKKVHTYYKYLKFKISNSVTNVECGATSANVVSDLSLGTSLKSISLAECTLSKVYEWNLELLKCPNLEGVYISRIGSSSNCTNWDKLKNCTKLTNISISTENNYKLTGNIQGLGSISSLTSIYINNIAFEDISEFANLINLKSLTASSAGIQDISPLSNLVNLNYLNLSYNNIANLKPLESLLNLEKLDLSYNCIYDTSNYIENGITQSVQNLTVMKKLNNDGKLRYLYLKGNDGITDWTPVSNINNWLGKSGW